MNQVEHRFLVSADIERWLKKYVAISQKSEQFYVTSQDVEECYYHRIFPDTYTKVTIAKFGTQMNTSVSKQEYASERKNHIGRILTKRSYEVTMGENRYLIEKYLKSLKGIYILTGIFVDERAYRHSEIMESLQTFILKEIDKDDKYSAKALALYRKPMEYNLTKLFEKIDEFEAPNLFFWQVPQRVYAGDGLSLLLYKNLRLLKYYKTSFQNRHFAATLHRLRVLLRRTATILEIFPDLYNPNVQRFCKELLERYYDETKELRYLYFLNELYSTKEENKLTLFSELKSLISQEEQAVTQMLLSQPFIHMINILSREIEVQENKKYISLKKEVKDVLRDRLERFETLLANTKDGYDSKMLEELYDHIDSLQTLIEDFFHIIGQKEAQILVDELNILLKPLRQYRNCKERAEILRSIKAHSETQTLDIKPLLCENEIALKHTIDHALKLLRGSKFYV